jgi:predicted DNA-binding transcriptional regulator AlpA
MQIKKPRYVDEAAAPDVISVDPKNSGCLYPWYVDDPAANEPQYIDETVAAAITHMSRAWFQRARWAGTGPPYIKVGRAVRYRLDELIAWFEDRKRTSTTSTVR